ncbi:hypothetical protein BS78_04G201500 [Paspalum vaginatum]|nr:hypothetical protein BS78_04G201500 [Paspalum vaginatum]
MVGGVAAIELSRSYFWELEVTTIAAGDLQQITGFSQVDEIGPWSLMKGGVGWRRNSISMFEKLVVDIDLAVRRLSVEDIIYSFLL